MLKGKTASKGRAIGEALVLVKKKLKIKEKKTDNVEESLKQFKEALEKSTEDLKKIREKTLENLDEEHAEIFDAHMQMVNDPEIKGQVKNMIEGEKLSAPAAYKKVTDQFIGQFEAMEDDYFRERAGDIKDIQHRVLSHMLGEKPKDMSLLETDTIVVAEDLTPSDTANLDLEHVRGFITEKGGLTSHTAIMARALNIPALVGVRDAVSEVSDGDLLYVDAYQGDVRVNPDEHTLKQARQAVREEEKRIEALKAYKGNVTETEDGHRMPLYANIGSPRELFAIHENGAEGIGLFRTEFMFMDASEMPSEDAQIEAYKEVFKSIHPVIVRTIDIGGDKELSYLKQKKEENPFLGKRAIRLCFDEERMFKTQLRALLIAAKDTHDVRIMFPMVATTDELRRALSILDDVKKDLDAEDKDYQKDIRTGIMIEIPSAALNAAELAKMVDFFSIGTNDLIQYVFAADRMNEDVAYLYQPLSPTLLRLIRHTVDGAKKEGIEIGVCGEMAGDLDAALLLCGMGMDELSMNASNILEIRKALSKVTSDDLKKLADDALKKTHTTDVKALLESFRSKHLDEE